MTNLNNLLKKSFLKVPRWLPILFIIGGFIGFIDASYLSILHYRNEIPPCSLLGDCETVLTSDYAVLWGVPVSLVGAFYYIVIIVLSILFLDTKNTKYLKISAGLIGFGFIFTLWLIYLQAFVINAFCQFCLVSAVTTTALFVATGFYVLKNRET